MRENASNALSSHVRACSAVALVVPLIAAATALATSLAAATPASAASLLGKNFEVGYYLPDTSTSYGSAIPNPVAFTAGAGVDATMDIENVLRITVDVGATSIDVFYEKIGDYTNNVWNAASFNGLIFTLQGGGTLDFTGIDVMPTAAMPGFDNGRASLTATQIFLNWQGLQYDNGGGSGSVVLAVDANLTPVPVPAAAYLFGSAVAAMAGVSFRRRSPAA